MHYILVINRFISMDDNYTYMSTHRVTKTRARIYGYIGAKKSIIIMFTSCSTNRSLKTKRYRICKSLYLIHSLLTDCNSYLRDQDGLVLTVYRQIKRIIQ